MFTDGRLVGGFAVAAAHFAAAAALVTLCRAQGLFLRDVGAMGRSFGDPALRIAVKDAITNQQMLEKLTRVNHCLPTNLIMSEASKILNPFVSGDARAADQLLPLVYDELRKLAASKMAHENPGQTLQATALVHEAWLKLTGGESERRWNDRAHFFAAAAEAMRRILIDNARRKQRVRHGGELERVDLEQIQVPAPVREEDELLAVHETLDELAALDARKAELVKLRFFVGLSFAEAAEVLGISEITAKRDWAFARAWLFRKASGGDPPDETNAPSQ